MANPNMIMNQPDFYGRYYWSGPSGNQVFPPTPVLLNFHRPVGLSNEGPGYVIQPYREPYYSATNPAYIQNPLPQNIPAQSSPVIGNGCLITTIVVAITVVVIVAAVGTALYFTLGGSANSTTTLSAPNTAAATQPIIVQAGLTSTTITASTTTKATAVINDCARYCEPTQECIPASMICDQYQFCPNNIDEINCTNCDTSYQYACIDGPCIYKVYVCDGIKDCPLGDDEMPPQCNGCNSNQFLCPNPHQCISANLHCDGVVNCGDSADESQCLTLNSATVPLNSASVTFNSATQPVNAVYKGVTGYYICYDNWAQLWSDNICKYLGYGNATLTSMKIVQGSFLNFNPSVSSSNLIAYFSISTCQSNQAVIVTCAISDCGIRTVPKDSVGPYIINGQMAASGAWPWQAVVEQGTYTNNYTFDFDANILCGGILISDRWIVTAAHCTVDSSGKTLSPDVILVTLGTISLTQNANTIYSRVDKVFTNPAYSAALHNNDVGLLRLNQSVAFSNTVRPICLPSQNQNLSEFSVCVATGFGHTVLNEISNNLLQLCIGTIPSQDNSNICQGDSGGPFACEDQNGVWTAIGINSYTVGTADNVALDECELSVVARMTACLSFIQSTMASNSV